MSDRINVAYVYTIYNESGERLTLLLKALAVVQTVPCVYYILFDPQTRRELIETIVHEFPGKFIFWPRHSVPKRFKHQACERGFVELYNLLETEYVCWNHSDDIPEPNRVEVQRQSLEANPTAVISLAGYWLIAQDKPPEKRFFKIVPNYGFDVGYPSGWMLNKKILPKIKVDWIYMNQFHIHWDVATLTQFLTHHSIVRCEQPLFRYNFRGIDYRRNHDLENGKYQNHWEALKQHFTKISNVISYPSGRKVNMVEMILHQNIERNLFRKWYLEEYPKENHLKFQEWHKTHE